ncbi:MAG: TIGR03086 family metal-binding protein [Nocardioidaceae bacterium]
MTALPAVDDGAALLERAVAYTRGCLALVRPELLARPTPCAGWDLAALLVHMDDALAAFTEAAEVGAVGLVPASDEPVESLVDRLRARACALVAAWSLPLPSADVLVGDHPLRGDLLAAAGALEIAVHGWDVATACAEQRPLPPALARELLGLLPVLVSDADRPARFGPPVAVPEDAAPPTLLLAALGRRDHPPR